MIYLEHTEGSRKGEVQQFDLDRIRIGRQADNEVRFDAEKDRQVSGRHAEIYREGGQHFVKDLQSRNGTFVGSRRIERPTPISDGDVIQFAPGGPAVRFWTRDPAATVIAPQPAANTSMTLAEPAQERGWRRRAAIVLGSAAGIAAAVGGVTGYAWSSWWALFAGVVGAGAVESLGLLGWSWWSTHHQRSEPRAAAAPAQRRARWPRTIGVVAVGVAIAAVLGTVAGYVWSSWWRLLWVFLGIAGFGSIAVLAWSSWKRRRHSEPDAAEELAAGATERDNLRDLVERWTEGVNSLRRSNLQQFGDDAVYALPWFLLLGEQGSGRSATVRAARPLPSSVASRRQAGPTRTCDWWFFDKCVVLDVAGRYVSPADEQGGGAEWRKLLDLLRRTRPREPVDGVVVTVSAEALAGRPAERLQQDAAHLRRRIDEMGRELGARFPVYVLVSNIDAIAGFTEFFGRLPDSAYDQAMGVANEDVDGRADGGAFVERAVRAIGGRLETLRLVLLNENEAGTSASDVFLFPEEFKTLARPLRTFAETLLQRNSYYETPPLRGMYFTSATQDGGGISRLAERMGLEAPGRRRERPVRPFFARHLFAQILPEGRGLVRRTAQWYDRHHVAQLAGVLAASALVLTLALAFTLSFVRNTQALRGLPIEACRAAAGSALTQLEECREAIESLAPRSRWASVSLNFGLRHTDQVAGALRDRYVEAVRRGVIEPLEARIDKKLVPGPQSPMYVAALLERIDLLGRCRSGACPEAAEWTGPRYAAMLAAEVVDSGGSDASLARLMRTHVAFLRWQREPAALDRMRGADAERVARWIRMGGLRAEWILASASTRFPAVRLKDFWGADGPAVVDGAYTARAWKEAIEPLVVGLGGIPAEQAETTAGLAKFQVDYRREGLKQWEAFLAGFSQGERLSGGRRAGRDLAAWVVAAESPYRRVMEIAATNVSSLAAAPSADVPAWARTLVRYAALQATIAEAEKLPAEEQKSRLKPGEREAGAYIATYGGAIDQLRAELATPDRAYRSALRSIEEGEPGAHSTHPVQKAFWSARSLRGVIGAEQGDDRLFWLLLQRPAELGWRVILDQAGVHMQQQWDAVWPELAAPDVPPAQRASRAIRFVNDKLGGFLELRGNRYAPRVLFQEGVPFTGVFLDYLSRARLFSPESAARSEPPRQIVAL